jgi:hypothetical protein
MEERGSQAHDLPRPYPSNPRAHAPQLVYRKSRANEKRTRMNTTTLAPHVLTHHERLALADIKQWYRIHGSLYTWRPASMAKLEARGLVRRCRTGWVLTVEASAAAAANR